MHGLELLILDSASASPLAAMSDDVYMNPGCTVSNQQITMNCPPGVPEAVGLIDCSGAELGNATPACYIL